MACASFNEQLHNLQIINRVAKMISFVRAIWNRTAFHLIIPFFPDKSLEFRRSTWNSRDLIKKKTTLLFKTHLCRSVFNTFFSSMYVYVAFAIKDNK